MKGHFAELEDHRFFFGAGDKQSIDVDMGVDFAGRHPNRLFGLGECFADFVL